MSKYLSRGFLTKDSLEAHLPHVIVQQGTNAEGTEGEAEIADPRLLEKKDGKEDWRRPA